MLAISNNICFNNNHEFKEMVTKEQNVVDSI
jgi:hypothetical protein